MYDIGRRRCRMKALLKGFFLVLVLSTLSTGCAVKVGRGSVFYPFGAPPAVLVTNNTKASCELFSNGNLVGTLVPGDHTRVLLGYSMNANQILTCKGYWVDEAGRKIYVGLAQADARPFLGGQDYQGWVISYYQQAQ